jgi:hypothetical protein
MSTSQVSKIFVRAARRTGQDEEPGRACSAAEAEEEWGGGVALID